MENKGSKTLEKRSRTLFARVFGPFWHFFWFCFCFCFFLALNSTKKYLGIFLSIFCFFLGILNKISKNWKFSVCHFKSKNYPNVSEQHGYRYKKFVCCSPNLTLRSSWVPLQTSWLLSALSPVPTRSNPAPLPWTCHNPGPGWDNNCIGPIRCGFRIERFYMN